MSSTKAFLSSAIGARIIELIRTGEDVESSLINDINDATGKDLDIKLKGNVAKLTQILKVLKANNTTAELDICVKALEIIIKDLEV